MSPEGPLVPYRLPDGCVVLVDDSAAKGAAVIDFTLQGGRIVPAVRVLEPAWLSENRRAVRQLVDAQLRRIGRRIGRRQTGGRS